MSSQILKLNKMKDEQKSNQYVNTTAQIKASLPSSPRQFSKIGKSYTISKDNIVIFETPKEARERREKRY